jgi:cytochrome b
MGISPVTLRSDHSLSDKPVRIWDLPTRVFHWLLAGTIFGAIVSANLGGNWMDWHIRLGGAALALLSFRIIWGIVGSRYARFSSFMYSPKTAWTYLRQIPDQLTSHYPGHNPAGAASVFALLLNLLLQVGTGLVSSDSISVEGPLAKYLSEDHVSLATTIHRWMEWPLYVLIGLHIGAVFFYLLAKKENLIRPMVTGDKHLPDVPPAADSWPVRIAGLGLLGTGVALSILFLH